jgi:putative hydrolase of the HAD superfamily
MKDFHNIRGVLFDIGDTLFGASHLMGRALEETAMTLSRRGIIPYKHAFCAAYREVDQGTQGCAVSHLYSSLDVVRRACRASGLEPSARLVGGFLARYRQAVRNGIRPKPGLVDFFRWLRNRRYRIGVVTDGTTVEQIEQLFRLGVLDFVDVMVTSEEIGLEKPDPRVFAAAASRLGLAYDRILMAGDSLERDIAGAQRAGMASVLVTQYHEKGNVGEEVMPDATVRSVVAIKDLLQG